MSIEISRVTPEDASRILALTAQDLREAHLPEDEVLTIANSSNPEHIKEQEQKLRLKPELYKVAMLDQDLVGFVKTNEWFTGDQKPYATPHEHYALAMRNLFHSHRLKGNPLGIFSLIAADHVDENRFEIASALLDEVLEEQNAKEVRIGVSWNEPLRPLLVEEYGFQPTGQHGRVLGIPHELHIRKPKAHSE
jgi:hypothetical protein